MTRVSKEVALAISILVILALFALATVIYGQTATQTTYNPKGFSFDHDLVGGADITQFYQFGFVEDRGSATTLELLWTFDVPKADVIARPVPEGQTFGTFDVNLTSLPALPVGKTYRAVVYAVDAEGHASFPSNITPEAFRFNACATESSTGVIVPSMAIQPLPPLKVGTGVMIELTITAPHDVQFITLDFLGDDMPGWYYVTKVAAGTAGKARVFWGPFGKAGTFELYGQIIDSGGCMSSLPFGTKVTVTP